MKAARVLQFGPPSVITNDDLPKPVAGPGQLLVHVKAAGVGHWDALVREGRSGLHQPLPLILGSELSGTVEGIGAEVSGFKPGDEVYGATNDQFTGAYAEYALPSAQMMALKPKTLCFIEAASVPVVAVTAWQMLFDYAHVSAGQTVLIHAAEYREAPAPGRFTSSKFCACPPLVNVWRRASPHCSIAERAAGVEARRFNVTNP